MMDSNVRVSFLVNVLLLITLFNSACKMQSPVEEGLSFEEYSRKAAQYINENEIDKAILYYEKALKVKSWDARTHYILGEIYDREYNKSLDEAQKKYTIHILTHPSPSKKTYRASTEELEKYGLKRGYKEMAIKEFKVVLKYEPENWRALYYIAVNYFNEKQFKEAIETFNRIIELNPEFSNSYGLIGEAYMEMGSYDFAEAHLKTAVKLEPNFARNYYRLGLVYRRMNNGDKVNEMLSKLKSMNSPLYDELRLGLFR